MEKIIEKNANPKELEAIEELREQMEEVPLEEQGRVANLISEKQREITKRLCGWS